MNAQVTENLWTVMRTDDHGNRSTVARRLTQRAAEELVERLTAKGHKQMYEAVLGVEQKPA